MSHLGDDDKCEVHSKVGCPQCPRYEYSVLVEGKEYTGWFWVGQSAGVHWGAFGDGVSLVYLPATEVAE